MQLDEAYPGGLLQYIRNARRLLQDSREGALRKQATLYCAPGVFQANCLQQSASRPAFVSQKCYDRSTSCAQARTRLTAMRPACRRGRSWTIAAIAATSWKPWVSRLLLVHSGRITCGRITRLSTSVCRSTRHPAPCAPANRALLDGRVYAWSASLGLITIRAGTPSQAWRQQARRHLCWWRAAWGSASATPASSWRCRPTPPAAPASCRYFAKRREPSEAKKHVQGTGHVSSMAIRLRPRRMIAAVIFGY